MPDLTIYVEIDASKAKSGANSVKSEMRGIVGESEKTTGRFQSLAKIDFSGLGKRLSDLRERFGQITSISSSFLANFGANIAANAVSLLTSKIVEGGRALLDFSSRMEGTKISFTTLTGSAQLAQKHLDDLKQFALETPFEFESLANASRRLQNVGLEAEKIIPVMRDIGNAAAAAGASSAELDSITLAFSQIIAKGKLSSEEVNQLAERGLPIWRMLSETLGKSKAEIIKLAEQGKISSDVFLKAFQKFSQMNFGGQMEKQSKTFAGAMSSIKDTILQTSSSAFEPLYQKISGLAVRFSQDIQKQQGDLNKVGQTIAKYVGEGLGLGLSAVVGGLGGYIGKRLKEIFTEGKIVDPLTKSLFTGMARAFTDAIGATTPELGIKLSIADLRKLDDELGGITEKVKKIPSLNNQLDSETAKKRAEALKNIIDNLNNSVAFFGQETQVAATKQQLLNAGIYDFNSAGAKTALTMADILDKLKSAQDSQKEYNDKLKAASDELKQIKENAEFEMRFANPSELEKFNYQVQRGVFGFRELSSEINATRIALQKLAFERAAKQRDNNLFSLVDNLQKMVRDVEDINVDEFSNKLREISDSLDLQGFKTGDFGNQIDITNKVFAEKVKGFVENINLLSNTGVEVDKLKEKFADFLRTFRTTEGLQIFPDDKIPQIIEYFVRLGGAIDNLNKKEISKTFNDTIAELDSEIQQLNIELGFSAELSRADAIAKELQKVAYKDLTPEMRAMIIAKAQEIDQLRTAVKAQDEYRKAFEKTTEFFEDALLQLSKGNWNGFFQSILDEMRRFLARAAAEWLSSQFFKLITNQGGGASGGGWLNNILKIFTGGGFGNGNRTPNYNPNIHFGETFTPSGVVPTGGGGGGMWGGWLKIHQDRAKMQAAFGGGGKLNLAGGLALAGFAANIIGSLVGGRAGSFISNIGSGVATGAAIGSIIPGLGTTVGAVIGGAFGLFQSILGGDPKRKIDKKENMPKLQQGFADALKQLKELAANRDALFNDPDGTLSKAMEIRAQIASGFGVQMQSKHYRNIANQQIKAKLDEADAIIKQIREMSDTAKIALDTDARLEANFASGVYMSSNFLRKYGQFKRRNGFLNGQWTGHDTLPSMLAAGEMVLNPIQIARVKANAGFDAFKGAGIPGYVSGTFVAPSASTPSLSASPTTKQPIVVKLLVNNSGIVESDIKDVLIESLGDSDVQVEVIRSYDKGKSRKVS